MNWEAFWAILFPKRCPFCGKRIHWSERACPLCSSVLPFLEEPPPCPEGIDGLFVPFSYTGAAEDAIRRLKFQDCPAAARHLAPYLTETLPEGFSCDRIIPIPMTGKKIRQRGYNQAALLAKFVGKGLETPAEPLLQKVRETKEQHTLNARERRRNLDGAYALRKSASVRGMRILLCDDVVTTGSTLQEAAAILKHAGAKEVYALAVAKTLPKNSPIPLKQGGKLP